MSLIGSTSIKIKIDFPRLRCSVWRNSNQIVLFLFRKTKIFAGFHENEKPTHPLFTTTPPSPPSSSSSSSIVVDTADDVDQFKPNLGSALKLEGSDRNEILTRKNLRHKKAPKFTATKGKNVSSRFVFDFLTPSRDFFSFRKPFKWPLES